MSNAITTRDLDILRTLLRVQLATTAHLQSVYFSEIRLTRRRLQILRERGLIVTHHRGLPVIAGAGSIGYWRLTSSGLAQVVEAFPGEPIPNNAIARAAKSSLRNWEHRGAATELYLHLIADSKKDAAEIGRRGSAIRWFPDNEVELHYQDVEGAEHVKRRLVPDATLEATTARVFIEVDRSTETRARCERSMIGYGRYVSGGAYQRRFQDSRTPFLLYVTKSLPRVQVLRQLSQATPGMDVVVASFDEAVPWLSHVAFGSAFTAPTTGSPIPSTEALDIVRELYEVAREGVAQQIKRGEVDPAGPATHCLQRAYTLLESSVK